MFAKLIRIEAKQNATANEAIVVYYVRCQVNGSFHRAHKLHATQPEYSSGPSSCLYYDYYKINITKKQCCQFTVQRRAFIYV